MKDGIIIQARTGSTRLPNKILLPFYKEERIIDLLIRNIKEANPHTCIILATTNRPEDDELEKIALQAGIECFRGDEDNVLNRFIGAAEKYDIDRIIRICSDNPFLRTDFSLFIEEHEKTKADYIACSFPDGRPTIKSHLGLYAELTTTEALRRVASYTDEKNFVEHVTIYLYTHPEQFKINLIPLPAYLNARLDLRFTLDTIDDFELLKELYTIYYEKTDHTIQALLALIENRPDYHKRMLKSIDQNEK